MIRKQAQVGHKPFPVILNNQYNVVFHMNLKEYYKLWIKGLLLSILTGGIYLLWTNNQKRAYLWSHTSFLTAPFDFCGTAKKSLLNMLPQSFFLLFCLSLPYLTNLYSPENLYGAIFVTAILVGLIYLPWAIVAHKKYILNQTKWGKNFVEINLPNMLYISEFIVGFFLTLGTVGFYFPYWRNRMFSLFIANTKCDQLELAYTGEAKDLLEDYISAFPAIFMTGGVYFAWLHSKVNRYRTANVWIGGKKIGSARGFLAISGSDYLSNTAQDIIMKTASLGLAWPYCAVYKTQFKYNRFAFIGNIDIGYFLEDNDTEKVPQASRAR